jgi:hypothetical protein
MSEKFTEFIIKDEVTYHAAEHECFIGFMSDWHNEAFQDWLSEQGWEHFTKWLETNKENYE